MAQKPAGNVVKIRLPEYLQHWLTDSAEAEFRTVEQQVVYLLDRQFNHAPEPAKETSHVSVVAAADPAPVGGAAVVGGALRYPLLDAPPAEVRTISIMGDPSSAMGPSFGITGKGATYRIADGLWDDSVAQAFFVVHGKRLAVYGQHDGWLYLR